MGTTIRCSGAGRARKPALSPQHIVQGLVAVAERPRTVEVQVRADDAGSAAVDEGHRSFVVDGFDDSDVGEAVVAAPVPVAIVGVAEEDQISGPWRSVAE